MSKPAEKIAPQNAPGPFRIHAVAKMTGASEATLRAWERRYGIPRPARTASAYRLFDERDVELVRTMLRLTGEGMAASEAARVARSMEPTITQSASPSEADPFAAAVDRALAAVKAFDADALDRELGRAAYLGSPREVYERVTTPLVLRVGQMWHDGTISVAHEHLATQRIVGTIEGQLRLVQPASGARKALLAAFADEDHVVGLLGAALAFSGFGYRVTLLGARTPPGAIREAIAALAPDVVGLSVIVPPPAERARSLVRDYAAAIGATPWAVGGSGVDAMAATIEACGGIVARGPASEWPALARSRRTRATTTRKRRSA